MSDYVGKSLQIELDTHPGEFREYFIEALAVPMVILREKGKSKSELYITDRILSIQEPEPEPPRKLRSKRINPITVETARRHLVDSHGYAIADINPMTHERAYDFHESINHEPLGHHHAEKKKLEPVDSVSRETAIAEAEARVVAVKPVPDQEEDEDDTGEDEYFDFGE